MPPKAKAKTAEDWVAFLLTLIDHTKEFKPDWEGFARETGLYKRGKFAQQAYGGLRKKHAEGHFGGTDVTNGTIPKTPGAKVTKAGKAVKRKVEEDDAHDDEDEGDSKSSSVKKRKQYSSNDSDDEESGDEIHIVEVKDDDVMDSIEKIEGWKKE